MSDYVSLNISIGMYLSLKSFQWLGEAIHDQIKTNSLLFYWPVFYIIRFLMFKMNESEWQEIICVLVGFILKMNLVGILYE